MNFTPHEKKCLTIVCKALLRNIEPENKTEFCVITTSKIVLRKIRAANGMTKSELTGATRTLSVDERNDCLDYLIDRGLIARELKSVDSSKKPTAHFKLVQAL